MDLGEMIGGVLDGLKSFFVDPLLDTIWQLIKGIIDGLATLADQVVRLLPEAPTLDLPDMSGWLHGYALLNTFLPLSEALALTAVVVGIYSALFLWRLGNKVWHLIPKPFVGT